MMGCCNNQSSQAKKRVTLTFDRKQLLYDIGNYSYVEGDLMQADDPHQRHQAQDVVQDGNVDRVTRVLNLAFAECVDLLYPYSKAEMRCGAVLNDELIESYKYVAVLSVPQSFSATSAMLLETLMHEYMVCKAMADWMSITNPQSSEKWERKIEDLKEKMTECVNARSGRVRRPMTPF